MQFVFPLFLGALATLALPVLIHLFYFRRFKKVYFTNVRFLKEVKEETSNRQRLRNLLVLLMRCLAILFLVLAFAQPFLPVGENVKRGEKAVSVYIDNSFSMEARSSESPLLELAKKRAREIVQAYNVADRFQILTNEFEGRDQRLISRDDALNRIEEVRISPNSRELSRVLARQRQALETGSAENKIAYVISDFQTNITDLDKVKDTLTEINLAPMTSVRESNLSIDSAWFENPVQVLNETATLFVQISNRSDEPSETARLTLRLDGQQKPVGATELAARSTRIDTVNITIRRTGRHEAELMINDYPVQFDDHYYFSYYVAERINVLVINGSQPNRFLNSAVASPAFFQLDQTAAGAIDYSKFVNYQLIVLNELPAVSSGLAQELRTFANNGGNVLAFPAQSADLNSYNGLLQSFGGGLIGPWEASQRQGGEINTDEFVFNDVYFNRSANLRLPSTQGNYKLPANRGEYILTYRDGSAMLAKYAQGEGALYMCAAPLNEQTNDLVRNPEIFVPLVVKSALAGAKSGPIAYTIGKDEVLEAPHLVQAAKGETVYKLRFVKDVNGQIQESAEFIPEQRLLGAKVMLSPGPQINEAGWYRLGLRPDSTVAEYAYNFDRLESDLQYKTPEELSRNLPPNMHVLDQNLRADFTQVVEEQNQGITLWRWCVVFALLFLLLEALLLRLWKP